MNKYRSIFISDTHLGLRSANTEKLLDFLENSECEYLYLVGDIVDFMALKFNFYWADVNNRLVKRIFDMHRNGTILFYIPGNHDEQLKSFLPTEVIHIGLDGKRYLITHGDAFDPLMQNARWLIALGNSAYELMMVLNKVLNKARGLLGREYWSLSIWAKRSFKHAANFINDYELVLSTAAKHANCVGIISGHIHHAVKKNINGIEYINCGDWLEGSSCVVETVDGEFKILES